MQPLKDNKNLLEETLLDAGAVVHHREGSLVTFDLGTDADFHRPLGRAKLQGVTDEVLKDLAQLHRVGQHRRQRTLNGDLRSTHSHLLTQRVQDLVDDLAGRHLDRFSSSGSHPGQPQQVLDEALHSDCCFLYTPQTLASLGGVSAPHSLPPGTD